MNSADAHKSTRSHRGMVVLGHRIAPGFKTLTPGRGTELFLCHPSGGDPEVQHKLDSIVRRKELRKPRMISPFLDGWKVTS